MVCVPLLGLERLQIGSDLQIAPDPYALKYIGLPRSGASPTKKLFMAWFVVTAETTLGSNHDGVRFAESLAPRALSPQPR
jgi:hypothetical protein